MKLPKFLQEKRDEIVVRVTANCADIDGQDFDRARIMFNACADILLPELEALIKSAIKYLETKRGPNDVGDPDRFVFAQEISRINERFLK